jgi:hypothetical protein
VPAGSANTNPTAVEYVDFAYEYNGEEFQIRAIVTPYGNTYTFNVDNSPGVLTMKHLIVRNLENLSL